jgi:general stress protein YciG
MNPDQVRELARRGGVAAHRAGTAHEFSSDEARAAGRKGGLAAHSGRKPQDQQNQQDQQNAEVPAN